MGQFEMRYIAMEISKDHPASIEAARRCRRASRSHWVIRRVAENGIIFTIQDHEMTVFPSWTKARQAISEVEAKRIF